MYIKIPLENNFKTRKKYVSKIKLNNANFLNSIIIINNFIIKFVNLKNYRQENVHLYIVVIILIIKTRKKIMKS